jgi:hypothetical protein
LLPAVAILPGPADHVGHKLSPIPQVLSDKMQALDQKADYFGNPALNRSGRKQLLNRASVKQEGAQTYNEPIGFPVGL